MSRRPTPNSWRFYNYSAPIFANKEVTKPDFSGLKIRVTPMYRPMVEKLGGTGINSTPPEVYTMLERNTVDGYGWATRGIFDYSWQKVTKYRVDPGFYHPDITLLANHDTWTKKLNDAQRKLLLDLALEIEASTADVGLIEAEPSERKLASRRPFSPADGSATSRKRGAAGTSSRSSRQRKEAPSVLRQGVGVLALRRLLDFCSLFGVILGLIVALICLMPQSALGSLADRARVPDAGTFLPQRCARRQSRAGDMLLVALPAVGSQLEQFVDLIGLAISPVLLYYAAVWPWRSNMVAYKTWYVPVAALSRHPDRYAPAGRRVRAALPARAGRGARHLRHHRAGVALMAWPAALGLMLGLVVLAMLLGLPVAFAFFLTNIVGAVIFLGGENGIMSFVRGSMASIANFNLAPVPLFLVMGDILLRSGMALRAIDAIDRLILAVPGRLSVVAVSGGTIFSALSGSTIATTAMLGQSLLPEMLRRGYHPSWRWGRSWRSAASTC
jgi:hypothetical protein